MEIINAKVTDLPAFRAASVAHKPVVPVDPNIVIFVIF